MEFRCINSHNLVEATQQIPSKEMENLKVQGLKSIACKEQWETKEVKCSWVYAKKGKYPTQSKCLSLVNVELKSILNTLAK